MKDNKSSFFVEPKAHDVISALYKFYYMLETPKALCTLSIILVSKNFKDVTMDNKQ